MSKPPVEQPPHVLSPVDSEGIRKYIFDSMIQDFAQKAILSAWIFIIVALGLAVHGMGLTSSLPYFRVNCLAIVLLNLSRLKLSALVLKKKISIKKSTAISILVIIVSGVLWGLLFFHVLELQQSEPEYIYFAFVAASGFVAASVVALNSFPKTAVVFDVLLIAPFIIVNAEKYYASGDSKFLLIPGILFFLLFFGAGYIFRLHKTVVNLYRNEAESQLANRNLQKAKDDLVSQTLKLVHSSRLASVGEMSGGIAHEINNPLAIILGQAHQIIRMANGHSELDRNEILKKSQKIEKSVDRISKIIKGLRQFSQLGEREAMTQNLFSKIIQDTVDMCGEKFKSHGIELKVEGNFEFYVNCQSVQISQILINLLNNAFDELSKIGHGQVLIVGACSDKDAMIHVVNSGPLIPEESRLRLFQPFFTTKAVGKGTGLGLSISQGLSREHGGDLVLLTGTTQTTFELRLPLWTSETDKKAS